MKLFIMTLMVSVSIMAKPYHKQHEVIAPIIASNKNLPEPITPYVRIDVASNK